MTDLENKAETTPSTQTSPADAVKPEVGHPNSRQDPKLSDDACGITVLFFFCRKRCLLRPEADSWASNVFK